MDRLGQGVCISYIEDRCRAELLYFLRKHGLPGRELYPPQELVWTKIGNVFGEIVPHLPLAGADKEAAIQIGFYDHLWTCSVQEVAARVSASTFPHFDDRGWAARLSEGKRAHADELESLPQAYRIELRGALDAREDFLADALRSLFEAETGTTPDVDEAIEAESVTTLKALIVAGAEKGTLGRDLPAFQIPALLHAAMRWDRRRNFRPTDRMDIYHASAALPYCDLLLTDGPLAALLRSGGVALDTEYGVPVTADFGEALGLVRGLLA
jgi:hypothetical protein